LTTAFPPLGTTRSYALLRSNPDTRNNDMLDERGTTGKLRQSLITCSKL
jgi:hypothetical protein